MPNHPTPEPEQESTVLELLLAPIDGHCRQPRARRGAGGDRAASPGAGPVVPNAITMASVMIDEIRLRAHARPLDEPEP
jgi:hypothetical protein